MNSYTVEGARRLSGEIEMHGAKNSALPILAATLLTKKSVIHNCPRLTDVFAECDILTYLGCKTRVEDNTVEVDAENVVHYDIPDFLMHGMRSSIVFLGAILSRCQQTRVSFPGGCELGPRPIDLHLSSLEKMGVKIEEDHGYLNCTVPDGRMHGAKIALSFPSVGATENIILAAVLAQGITAVTNAAREPEIVDLANFLNACGARIYGAGEGTIWIEGVQQLHDAEYSVIPDRIATVTYLCAAAATRGEVLVKKTEASHLAAVLPILEETGCAVRTDRDSIYLRNSSILKPVKVVRTMPYPGFPTDAQAPLMALCCLADGTSVFVENIFENRYKHAAELARMGAKISVEGRVAVVEGVQQLHSAPVTCTDLRGGAALVIAALTAEGKSEVCDIRHIERGYEDFAENLARLGAQIKHN